MMQLNGKGGGRGRGRGRGKGRSRGKRSHPLHIFQIGFNKCGTRSLTKFFRGNGVKSVHYDGGRIADSMFRHYRNGRPLVGDRYEDTVFFADMENPFASPTPLYVAQTLFRVLDRQYPNSKFILNIRDKEAWIRSRLAHDNGDYLKNIATKYGVEESVMIERWRAEWDRHLEEVQHYFRNRPLDLLVYNIETDSPLKLVNFFQHDMALDTRYFDHYGKSSTTSLEKAAAQL